MIWVFQIEPESENSKIPITIFICFNPINKKLGIFFFCSIKFIYIWVLELGPFDSDACSYSIVFDMSWLLYVMLYSICFLRLDSRLF